MTFAVPWYDMLLLGTTDIGVRGGSGRRRPSSRADVDQILSRGGRRAAAPTSSTADRVRATYAGLRVLPAGRRRERERAARDRLQPERRRNAQRRRRQAHDVPTDRPRGPRAAADRARPAPARLAAVAASGRGRARPMFGSPVELEPRTFGRTSSTCTEASRADVARAGASSDPSLLERLHPAGPDIAAQVALRRDARVGAQRRRRPQPADDMLLPRPRRTTPPGPVSSACSQTGSPHDGVDGPFQATPLLSPLWSRRGNRRCRFRGGRPWP